MSMMTEERKKYLLDGAVDLHVHTAPSISPRELDVAEMARDAMKYGLKGFVAKDHYFCSTGDCQLINKHICGGKEICFGLMAMNNSMGGFNLKAVSTACEMGTKIISLPTVSAREHQEYNVRPGVVPLDVYKRQVLTRRSGLLIRGIAQAQRNQGCGLLESRKNIFLDFDVGH